MAVVIRNEVREILLEHEFPMSPETFWNSRELMEDTKALQRDFGAYNILEYKFDGMHMIFCNAEVYEDIFVATDDIMPHVSMLFMERGDMRTSIQGVTDNFRFSSRQHNIMYTPYREESASIRKQMGIQVFGLNVTPEKFLELADNNGRVLGLMADRVAGRQSILLADKINPHITPRMQGVIGEIRNCQFTGGLKKLFFQSKVMELLALQCEQIENEMGTGTSSKKISAREIEQLHHARQLLLDNIQDPPNLDQLARKTGLNEFKLKSGFKAVFDTTVFGYLSDHRLNLARELIRSGGKSLAAIAEEAGYSSPQHFSNAFKKKFGVSPRELRV